MKKAPVYFAIILFLCTAGLYSAEISDTKDSSITNGFDLIVIGGVGSATGSVGDPWGSYFSGFSPAVSLGLEVPFTKSHMWSLELYEHFWTSKLNSESIEGKFDKYLSTIYMKYSDERYSQIGLSGVIKAYIFRKTSPIRVSFHFGFMGLSQSKQYGAIDIGCAVYYNISDNFSVSINRKILFGFPNLASGHGGSRAPNLLMLNLSYKFKL